MVTDYRLSTSYIKVGVKIQKEQKIKKLKVACFLGTLQPWNSDSTLSNRQLEPRTETESSGTPQSNGGMRLHDFVSKTVDL